MAEGGGAWKDGHVCFFLGAGSLTFRRRGPRVGWTEIRSRYSTVPKVQCPIPPVEFANRDPNSFPFCFNFPSVIITTTNQPPLRPRPLIPQRGHCDLPNFGQRPAEGSPPRDARAGPGKVWHVIRLSPHALSLSGAVSRSPDQGGRLALPSPQLHQHIVGVHR